MLHFEDRIRIIPGGFETGECVLYWMRTAVRIDYNPALITALELGKKYDKPVLVYHAVSERYPYASDRHHTFIIEGAMDISQKMKSHRIPYVFHVERKGHRGPHLETLAKRAVAVVTEDMPIPFLQSWTEGLTERANTTLYLVDTDCLVPMKLSRKAPTRAFQFRDRFKDEREHRLHNIDFPTLESLIVQRDWSPDLPFDPVDLETASIPNLLKDCAIDHSVFPVAHTTGGSDAAQKRWREFKDNRLGRYHKMRNDPLRKGVSRMSAYLHYGMISSFQLAKESLSYGAGGEKYRDELLIWRELSHHWCSKVAMPQHWMAVPQWARETLQEHELDPREDQYYWHALRWAETNDELWNLCQHSLNVYGELHNNLRMTWGKQIIQWTTPRKALLMVLDLNNRLALDGRDPSSYGGILWCFGLFDRPFKPGKRVWGTIRPRTTESHAQRLDVEKYKQLVTKLPYATVDIHIHGSRFVACLIQQAVSPYGCTITSVSNNPTLHMPEQFSTNHQTKLLLGAWIEAEWLVKQDDAYTWTSKGQTRFSEQWASIRQNPTVAEMEPPYIKINDETLYLSRECTLLQYQEAMHFISTELRRGSASTQPTQMELWST